MKYKLYKDLDNSILSTTETILMNRDIPLKDLENWIYAGWDQINSWHLLNKNQMIKAVERVHQAITVNKEKIIVIVDSDQDGFSSAAIFLNYFYNLYPEYNIDYIMHQGKEHGLSDLMDILIQYDLVISPDGGTNDTEQCKILKENDIDVIILDHHLQEQENPYCILINNQLCDYPNKELSGAGVVWQFCRAYDELYAAEVCANNFLDLCAYGNLSDMMLISSLETRAIINLGLANIHNPFLYEMAKTNEYTMNKHGGNTYMGVAFGITPMCNAVIRSGTQEEKELVFKAFLLKYAFEKVPYSKRGHKGEEVYLYEEAVHIANAVKRRQTKLQDEGMALLENKIKEQNLLNNAVIVLCCEPGEIERNLAGLVANKYQAKYQRPCLILTKTKTAQDKEYIYRGSARNYSMSEIENFKDICENSGLCNFTAGHQGAFGCAIPENKIDDFVDYTNNLYSNISNEPIYWVDYIWNINTIDSNAILEIAEMQNYWGQGCPESQVCVKDICLSNCSVQLLSKDKHPTLKITLPNGIALMKFNSSEEEFELFLENNKYLTIVGQPNKNEWMGNITPQILIDDFELEEKWIF